MQAKHKSRPQQWVESCNDARNALDRVMEAIGDYDSAMQELRDLKEGYEEWRGNLPDNLASSALAEKLDEIINMDLDIEIDVSDAEGAVSAAENADLPRGFGRD